MSLILRRVYELTADDLRAHPVWGCVYGVDADEPWYDEVEYMIDEVTYRPWPDQLPYTCTVPCRRDCLVAGVLTLTDGTRLSGYFQPPALWEPGRGTDLSYLQPHAFAPDGRQCGFWSGGARQHGDRKAQFYAAMRKAPSAVFPIHYRALPGLLNVDFEGIIDGFRHLAEDLRTVITTT